VHLRASTSRAVLLGRGRVPIRRTPPRQPSRAASTADRPTVADRGIGIVQKHAFRHRPRRRGDRAGVEACRPCCQASNVDGTANEEGPVATADEVRDALFERIAYHAISADTDEVLTLAPRLQPVGRRRSDDEDDDDEDDD
jgi:hypothetical protein